MNKQINELQQSLTLSVTDWLAVKKIDAVEATKINIEQLIEYLFKIITVDMSKHSVAFKGGATLATETNPTTPEFWFALESGTYTEFDGILIDISEGLNILIWNGEDWVKLIIPIDLDAYLKKQDLENSIFTSISRNLFDKENITPGYYVDYASGVLVANADYNASDFIRIEPETEYFESVALQISFFDEDRVYISGLATPAGGIFETPSNAVFIRTGVNTTILNTYLLKLNSDAGGYEPYKKGIKGLNIYDKNILGTDVPGIKNIVMNKDLFFHDENFDGFYVDYLTGSQYENAAYNVSDFILIKPNKIYSVGITGQVAFFDKNKIFISGSNNAFKFTKTPESAYYARISTPIADLGKQFLIEGGDMYKTAVKTADTYVSPDNGGVGGSAGSTSTDYIPIDPGEEYEFGFTGGQNYAFYNKDKVYISGYSGGVSGEILQKVTAPKSARFIRMTTVSEQSANQSLSKTNQGFEVVRIVATRNVADFCSIREIANAITDACFSKRYIIFVPNGTWEETDWQGWGKYIKIIGQSRHETIIVSDGNSAKIAPVGYSFATEEGKAINVIDKSLKHLVFAKKDIDIENLTLKEIDGKYVIHADYPHFNSIKFKNLTLIEDGCNNAVGIGVWGGQKLNFSNIKIKSITGGAYYGVFFHNWNDQVLPTATVFKNVKFENCDFALINELGSNQSDELLFENCYSDTTKKIEISAAGTGVGYDIDLICAATEILLTNTNRPLISDFSQTGF